MRKRVSGFNLNRDSNQRKALFKSLISSLIINGELTTTITKAKAIKGSVEKLVTKAKRGSVSDLRQIFKVLDKKDLVEKLHKEIAPLFKTRNGGYLRIVRLGKRYGDRSEMVKMVFTENVKNVKTGEVVKQEVEEKVEEIKEVEKKIAEPKKAKVSKRRKND